MVESSQVSERQTIPIWELQTNKQISSIFGNKRLTLRCMKCRPLALKTMLQSRSKSIQSSTAASSWQAAPSPTSSWPGSPSIPRCSRVSRRRPPHQFVAQEFFHRPLHLRPYSQLPGWRISIDVKCEIGRISVYRAYLWKGVFAPL